MSTSDQNTHTICSFTNLPPHKSFSPTNTNMKLLSFFTILAFGSSLAAANTCTRKRDVTGVYAYPPPSKGADKEAGPLEPRTYTMFW